MTHFAEALAHARQLIELGCSVEQAVADTGRAFELDSLTMEVLESNLDLLALADTCS